MTSAPASSSKPASRAKRDPIRVLVVDDDARVLAAIRDTIALEADMVVSAEAADHTRALAAATPDVALVDVLLPDAATGIGLVGELSRRPGCAVVAMSVRGDLAQPAVAAGATAFVEKSADIDAVLDAVRRAARLE
jgi:DNA-binding NtrC family response regulator